MKTLVGVAAALAITLTPLGVATSTSAATSTGAGIAALSAAKPDPKQQYKDKAAKVKEKQEKKIDQADRDAAAARALQEGALNPLMMVDAEAMAAAAALPGEAPRYFSHPNYANSPLPTVTVTPGAETTVGNPLVDRQYATDAADGVFVMLDSALADGLITGFEVWNQANADPSLASAGKSFHAYVLRPTRFANQFSVVFDSGLLTMPALTTAGTSEVATFGVANLEVKAGDRLAFYGQGIPLAENTGTDKVFYPSPLNPLQGEAVTLPSADFPAYQFLRTYSFRATMAGPSQVDIAPGTGIRKFVDELPGLGEGNANELGQYIPAAVPDTTTYPGSDYYIIELGEYTEQMHSDLPATTLRGYRQANMGGTPFNYLGPAIVATKDRPVRILFKNMLPTGTDGNLFIPTDTTVMGSGMTAAGHTANPEEMDPTRPMCTITEDDGTMKASMVAAGHCYAENRATLHLHGGITPWISDGTPHQWITPAGQATGPNGGYPKGVSVQNVPDMPDPGPGAQTFFYTNAQSARLMFYHDHAWGITRLNVYAGEAAPYIITDDTEKALVDSGTIPGADSTIPLVIQDKTFVPDPEQLALQDETWNYQAWGDKGDLWLPHVYSPAQNPGDASGVNAYGRWAYGPWFWPPTSNIDNPPMPNPYFDPLCDPDVAGWCEPALMPGTPYNSMGMEAFMDTPVVNGTAYPTVTLDPKSYRLRILNAANDRFFNLSLYQAVDADGKICDAANTAPAAESTGVACTEVALNPAEVEAALADPTVFPTPVAGTEGPDWISIGTEGGFLPAPVKVPAQPTTWVNDPTVFNAGNVDQHSLLVAPAERQDVIVDLSAYAGQTLIVYNDAPAAFPARDPRYDYYTGNGDYRDSGGVASTLPGYGPNTRTVMQIKVNATEPAAAFDFPKLQAAFAHKTDGSGVFEKGQKPIVVGQGEYNSAYGTAFPTSGPLNGTVQIYDTSLTFNRLVDDATPGAPFTTSTEAQRLVTDLKPKMIQDEMGEAFEREYGRMSGFLGVETPNAQAGLQNMILYPYTLPPTEILDGLELPPGMEATPISSAADGTQIWKFTHNGVDTHPVHFHLYDVQLLNRVGWDGIVRKPDPTELGWKDTVRISPLEDTIVAVRPIVPPVPAAWNGLPNSVRLLDPSMPAGAMLEDTTAQEAAGLPIFAFNPDGEPIDVVNHYVNFGWEYVLHCHILSHEEMDMMRSQIIAVNPSAPTNVTFARTGNGANRRYVVNWTDTSKNETAFVIERRVAGSNAAWTQRAMVQTEQRVNRTAPPVGTTTTGAGTGAAQYVDTIGNTNTQYEYRVYAVNTVGDTWDYSNPAFNAIPAGGGFPTVTVDSRTPGQGSGVTVAAPTALTGTLTVKNRNTSTVNLRWTDNATNETGFLIQRSNADGTNVVTATVGPAAGTGTTVTFSQSVGSGVSYLYRVLAFSGTTQSGWSNTLRLP